MPNLNIEVEQRGPLEPQEKKKLIHFLEKEAVFISESNQLTVFCETSDDRFGTIDNAKARLSVGLVHNFSSNQIFCSLKAKFGSMESQARKEIEFPFEISKIQDIFDFLKLFGVNSGCPRFYHRLNFRYNGFLVTIKDEGLVKDHFEIEIRAKSKEEITCALQKINCFAATQELKLYSEEKYREVMLELYRNNPPLPFEEIDLSPIISKADQIKP